VGIDPALEAGLQFSKIDHSTDRINLIPSHKKVCDIVVTMEIFAFSSVTIQSMSGAKLDSSHDGQRHNGHLFGKN
jgi:hypothetical protein